MGASSVTGVSGPGDSLGQYKPYLHCGGCACGCGSPNCEPEPTPPVRTGCSVPYRSGGTSVVKSANTPVVNRGC